MSDTIGIDIGSYAIKVAVAQSKGAGIELTKLASDYNPIGMVLSNDKTTGQKLAETLKKLASEQKLSGQRVFLSLPESLAYTAVVSMPFLSDAELASSINWEAEQHIPVPLTDINLEYSVLYKPPKSNTGEKMRVLLVGARKEVVTQLVDLFSQVGMEVIGLVTGVISLSRGLNTRLSE